MLHVTDWMRQNAMQNNLVKRLGIIRFYGDKTGMALEKSKYDKSIIKAFNLQSDTHVNIVHDNRVPVVVNSFTQKDDINIAPEKAIEKLSQIFGQVYPIWQDKKSGAYVIDMRPSA